MFRGSLASVLSTFITGNDTSKALSGAWSQGLKGNEVFQITVASEKILANELQRHDALW
jgi:hypothetical protein